MKIRLDSDDFDNMVKLWVAANFKGKAVNWARIISDDEDELGIEMEVYDSVSEGQTNDQQS